MTDQEIGEYSRCPHGLGGGCLFGCIPCAIEFYTQRQVDAALDAERYLNMLRRLEDEQIYRNMAKADPQSR